MTVVAHPLSEFVERVHCVECGQQGFDPVTDNLSDTDIGSEHAGPLASTLFRFVRCSGCSTVYLRDRVRQEHIGDLYNTEYHCYRSFDERGFVFRLLAGLLAKTKARQIARLFPDAERRLVDYGCGAGHWLDMLRRSGLHWQFVGTEISEGQVDQVRALGLEGEVCDHTSAVRVLGAGSTGVIHLFHVLEHLPDPIEALDKLRQVLKPGGAIVGQTPNVRSWDCRLFGRYWSQWHVPRHLVMYDPDQLARHAEAAGLEVVQIRSSLVGATNWAASLQKWWTLRRGANYGGMQSGALYPLLTLAMIPLTLLQSWFSHTSDIDFVFRRPL